MPWTIILEDEHRAPIEKLDFEFTSEIITDPSNLEKFKLIKYLDPYGDTVFNRHQMDDLIADFEKLKEISRDDNIAKILELALKCKTELHTYLAFYDD